MTAYYNEHDPYCAQWLHNLIDAGEIAPGFVDSRSITEIDPDELTQYTQCHFFAGVGVWSHALRRAGWSDDIPVWTGSCPCQPFSAAGSKRGTDDERHLWPVWYELIRHCRPSRIFGEQVASADVVGRAKDDDREVWLDVVCSQMERAHYAISPFDLPASSAGADHIRQRIFFAAEGLEHSDQIRLQGRISGWQNTKRETIDRSSGCDGSAGKLGDTNGNGCQARGEATETTRHRRANDSASRTHQSRPADQDNSIWSDTDWLSCKDGYFRPVEPGTFPLVDESSFKLGSGSPYEGKSRAKMISAYGNALSADVTDLFITAYMRASAPAFPAVTT